MKNTVFKIMLVVFVVFAWGATSYQFQKTYIPNDWVSVYNIKHDSHWFVIAQDTGKNRSGFGGTGVGIVHHPDCPCHKKD